MFAIVGSVSSSDENKTYTCIPFDGPTLCPVLASFRTNLLLMMEAALPSKILCVWRKMRLRKMSNIRHFNNMYLPHTRLELAHVFRVYRQQMQIQNALTKNTEELYLCCHLCYKQAMFTAVICIILSPSRVITRDLAVCSLKSILRLWKGFWVTIYIYKFVIEVSKDIVICHFLVLSDFRNYLPCNTV